MICTLLVLIRKAAALGDGSARMFTRRGGGAACASSAVSSSARLTPLGMSTRPLRTGSCCVGLWDFTILTLTPLPAVGQKALATNNSSSSGGGLC